MLRPTVSCNQDCLFCSANETSDNVWETDEAMLAQIARAARRGVERLAFGGGEPTLARALPSWIRAARELGVEEVELVTNGVLLDREARVAALAEAGLTHAFVSLHAHDERLSRQLTQKEGDFARTVAAIGHLDAAGVKTAINHVITRRNFRYVPDFVRFVHERFGGRVAISLAFVTPQYKALEHLELVPPMRDVRPFVQAALAEAIAIGQPVWVGARQGLPPCQLGPYRAWSDVFEHADAGIAEDAPQKVRGPSCDRCRYTEVCTGVWRPYAERHGTDDLVPIEGPPFTGRERVAFAALKDERWGLPPSDLEALPAGLRDPAPASGGAESPPPAPEREPGDADDPDADDIDADDIDADDIDADDIDADDIDADALDAPFAPAPTRPIRVALFGSAARARALAKALRELPGASLEAVVSPHATPSPDFGGCPVWDDAATALEEMRPDAVIVAAARSTQGELSRLALDAGAAVLVSRPVPREATVPREVTVPARGTLVAGYALVHLPDVRDATAWTLRVGPDAPRAWSRRALGPWLEDVLALAVAADPEASLEAATFLGEPRPEAVGLRVGERDVALDLGPGAPRLTVRRDDAVRHVAPEATVAMLKHFLEVAAGHAAPLLDRAAVAKVRALRDAALDALETEGLVFERPDAPKHAASRSFRER
ncbi:MAG: radical SAM protein [Sandaracinaceae bacterium]